jgi:hypothetical protein
MRNYWLRIILGAVAVFTVGMVGITLARQGIGRVRGVVEGSGPITLPVAFIPFKLEGQKLGTIRKVVLERDAPKQIAGVEIEVKLADSAVARGLEGCRLAANLDKDSDENGDNIRVGPLSHSVFTCVKQRDSLPEFEEFGRAIFQPGEVAVPLLLPADMVNDLREGHFDSSPEDSIGALAEARADSIADAAEAKADSISDAAQARAESTIAAQQKQAAVDLARHSRFLDSLRREGQRRADSARHATRSR